MKQLFKTIKIGSLALSSPVVGASGTVGFLKEIKQFAAIKAIGAGITKTITLEPRIGNKGVRIAEVDCGILNAIGLENPGIDMFLKDIHPQIKDLGPAIIVSVAAREEAEFIALAKKLEDHPAIKAVELNLSCPNVKGNIISQYPEEVYKAVKAFRSRFSRTLIAKLTPEVTDIVQTAFQAQEAGADALNLVNTFLGIKFDLKTQKPVLGNLTGGYSGKGIKPMALYRVWRVCSKMSLPVIGGGGIQDWQDAAEFFIAGATAVSIGTANFIRPNTAEMVAKGLYGYMRENKIKELGKLEIIR